MGGKSTHDTSSQALEDIAKQLFSETTPLRGSLIEQFMSVLSTGGAGAQLPAIQRAVEGSMQATSNTLRSTRDRLAQTGLAGTPFGEMITTSAQGAGDFATSQVGPNMAMQLLQMIPGFTLGQGQQAVSGLGTAGGIQAQNAQTNMSPWLAMINASGQAARGFAG